MNPLLQEAAGSVRFGWVLGVLTVLFLSGFLWWVWYAYTPKHKQMLDEAARLPFDDGGDR